MGWRRVVNEVRALFHRRRDEADLHAEWQSYVDEAARDRRRAGAGSDDADRLARASAGSLAAVKDHVRDAGWESLSAAVAQDVRFGWRMLRRSSGFSALAVLTLAVGIGATTAIFSLVDGVLLRPLPYPDPDRLVSLDESKPNFDRGSISYPNFLDWRHDTTAFSAMAVARGSAFTLTGAGGAERVTAQFVTSDFFPMLGVAASPGRLFRDGEDAIGRPPIVLVSEDLWRRALGSAPDIVGRTLTLDGRPYTAVGVISARATATLPAGRAADVYLPIGQWTNNMLQNRAAGLGIHGLARLKPGVTIAQARADLLRVTRELAAAYPTDDAGIGATITPLAPDMVGHVRPYLWLRLGAVALVQLIACVNVGTLLLARSAARAREFAVRASLGAGRRRLLLQMLTESLLLAGLGGLLGVWLAWWSVHAVVPLVSQMLPRANAVAIDAPVLGFALALSVISGVLFGLAPALRIGRADVHDALRAGRSAGGGRAHPLGRFVAAEVALAFVLLVGAGLMIRTLGALWRVDPGFDPRGVLAFGVSLPPSMRTADAATVRSALRSVTGTLAHVPGVLAVSLSWGATPMFGDDEDLFWFEGEAKPKGQSDMKWALSYVVEPDYLKVMGTRLLRGRFFTDADDERARHVVVIDEIFAQTWFAHRDPIGQHLFLDSKGGRAEIVGVVEHVKQWGLDADDGEALRTQLYFPYMQLSDASLGQAWNGTGALARVDRAAPVAADTLRAALQRANPDDGLFGATSMTDVIAATLETRRFAMIVFAAFAIFAVVLASGGIYGVVAYAVLERTPEIGVRLALGAQPRDVIATMVASGMRMTVAGAVAGGLAAMGLARLIRTLLYGVGAADPLTFAGVAGLLLTVALAACWIPARRAARVDPAAVLRR